jgi:hypothetical protein
MTSYTPQITYYSRCASEAFSSNPDPSKSVEDLPGEPKFMVLIEEGKRQPAGDELAGLVALTDAAQVTVSGEARDGLVFRFAE